jgi:ribosome maturation factor RimP
MMDNQAVIEQIKKAIFPILEDTGSELVQLDFIRTSGQVIIRVLVDKSEGGISLDECTRINKRLGDILDEQDIIPDRYVLEVSSPGLDRPLKNESDFRRCLNKKVKFFLLEPVNGKLEWDGLIKGVSDGQVNAEVVSGMIQIPLAKINKAKQLV